MPERGFKVFGWVRNPVGPPLPPGGWRWQPGERVPAGTAGERVPAGTAGRGAASG